MSKHNQYMAAKQDLKSDLVRLRHMLDASKEALEFIKGRQREELESNRMLTLALLKEVELIGEAASKVSAEFQDKFSEIPWKLLIGTRNRLVHGYFDINLDVVWQTITVDLLVLKDILEQVVRKIK